MLATLIICGLLLAIVVSLFTGLYFLLKDSSQSRRTLTALKVRVGLSLTLIVFLVVAAGMGWIHPHAIGR